MEKSSYSIDLNKEGYITAYCSICFKEINMCNINGMLIAEEVDGCNCYRGFCECNGKSILIPKRNFR